MSPTDITRAWKDYAFREHLNGRRARAAAGASRWCVGDAADSQDGVL